MEHSPDTACCAPAARTAAPSGDRHRVAARSRSTRGQLRLSGGTFAMGDRFDEGYVTDGEQPVHAVTLPPFHLAATAVTNAQFAAFVKATGYLSDAERFGSSAVFHLLVEAPRVDVLGSAAGTPWWLNVRGACWRNPGGALSTIADRQNHPVVHVSWYDAQAYCSWAGQRLPTEAEWEFAARGGLEGKRFAWGDELTPGGRWMCNIWQGDFPVRNAEDDGFLGTAPVKRYRPNGYGLWNMAGNVWEWCADWFSADYYASSPTEAPPGPSEGESKVMRGGSYLCHDSYCHRYRVAARSSNTPESSAGNIGFRCANDAT